MDHDPKTGQFAEGNRAAAKRRMAKQIVLLKAALVQSVSPDDILDVVETLLELIKEKKNLKAAELLFSYLFGKPQDMDLQMDLEEIKERLNIK